MKIQIRAACRSVNRVTSIHPKIWIMCLSVLVWAFPIEAKVIHVNVGVVGGANDGTSWANAFNDLSNAIENAVAGDEVWVAQGTYVPTRNRSGFPDVSQSATFSLKGPNIRYYGGFVGNETLLSQRQPLINRVFLSGNNSKLNVVTADQDRGVNSTTVLDGFSIINGRNWNDLSGNGAGMYFASTSMVVKNCIFENNSALYSGGAVYLFSSGSYFINCRFSNNTVLQGGFQGGGVDARASTTFINCQFDNNSAISALGAGLFATQPTIINCSFINNTAGAQGKGGGLYISGGTASIRNSIFWGNTAGLSPNPQIDKDGLGLTDVQYSVVQGGYSGNGNLTADPLLELGSNGFHQLNPLSPVLDQGNKNDLPQDLQDIDLDGNTIEQISLDIIGNSRISFPGCGQIDPGPLEYQKPFVIQTVLYVDINAAGNNDGSNWQNAFTHLQDALCVASTEGSIQQIWVADGTYIPNKCKTYEEASFIIRSGLAIYGGFQGASHPGGGETTLLERNSNPELNNTILNGSIGGNLSQSSSVVRMDSVNSDTVLDGFTIRNGNAENFASLDQYTGGGLFIQSGSPSIRNCFFLNNQAVSGGGAVYVNQSTVDFSNCVFINNLSDSDGGAIRAEDSTVGLLNCHFIGNSCGSSGGAIYAANSPVQIESCYFENNFADGFGGAVLTNHPNSRLINNQFIRNRAANLGGGVSVSNASIPIISCIFSGNQAEFGGGLACNGAAPVLQNSVFAGNRASTRGGAIQINSSSPAISFSTFVMNESSGTTGGIAVIGTSSPSLSGSILWLNKDFDMGENTGLSAQVSGLDKFTPNNCCIMGISSNLNGNFSLNPQFIILPDDGGDGFGNANDNYGNLRLMPTSPCLDRLPAGLLPQDLADLDKDGDTSEFLPSDLDGFTRVKDIPFFNNGGVVDLGPYELPTANIRFWGEELEPPIAADPPEASTPVVDNLNAAFIHPSDNRVYGYDFGLVNVSWSVGGVPSATTVQYVVLEATSTAVMYRTDAPNRGPQVDLNPVIDNEVPAELIVHYNSQIKPNPDLNNPLSTADVFMDQNNRLNARKSGKVLIEYRERFGQSNKLAFEVLEIRNPVPVVIPVRVGEEVFPSNMDYYNPHVSAPVITRGNGSFAFQHQDEGPTQNRIFSIRPTTNANQFEVYWFKQRLLEVNWPFELARYTASWPPDPVPNLRGDYSDPNKKIPEIDMSRHEQVQIMFQDPPGHANPPANKRFSTRGPGMCTLMYTDFPQGKLVSFQVVQTIDHEDVVEVEPWIIGNRIESENHETTCYASGYIFDGTAYDSSIYNRDASESFIIPVNRGVIEVWWYREYNQVCYPWKASEYYCEWPEPGAYDGCIIIANQKGFGPLNQITKYKSPSIYEKGTLDSDPQEIGYNPNEEHAQWSTSPGSLLFAARDDLNGVFKKSDPFVLLKYRDSTLPKQPWDMDVIRVARTNANGTEIPGCECEAQLCTFVYSVTAADYLRAPLPLSLPKNDPGCASTTIVQSNLFWNDSRGKNWFRRGGQTATARYYERWEGNCSPWLDDGTSIPQDVSWVVEWPQIAQSSLPPGGGGVPIKNIYIDLQLGETRVRDLSNGVRQAEILYNEAGASLIRPWKVTFLTINSQDLPEDYIVYYKKLPPHIQARLSYDTLTESLIFKGVASLKLLGIMSPDERDIIKSTFNQPHHTAFKTKIDQLYQATQQQGISQVGTIVGPDNPNWGIALSAGRATQPGWIVLGYNGNRELTEPSDVEVFKVECPNLHSGSIIVVQPDCVFDESQVLRWSGDCAGDCSELDFYWEYAVGDNPDDIDDIDPAANPGGVPVASPWQNWIYEDGSQGWKRGKREVIIDGSRNPLFTLTDNWFRVRVRVPPDANPTSFACPPGSTSNFTSAQLAEGWIKRVKRQLNPFDQRIKDFTNSRVATYVSMLEQLGTPYQDRVGLTCDAETINSLGLIEMYQGVLFRGKQFTVDNGIDYGPANQALLLMAGGLNDFYMLLGNEAYGDALDPTIALDTQTNEAAGSIFCFQDQLPTNENSLLYEELALLRGMDGRSGTPIDRFPVENRLYWNFTSGDGQVAYARNYDVISLAESQRKFPQGHGDAWGHYLTAIKFYYELLRNNSFTWQNRTEAVLVDQTPVSVSYLHERKFARSAAAKAKCGAEIMNLTYRSNYVEDPSQQWQGYKDPVTGRYWGVSDWGRRSFMGAYFDWAVGNAMIPAIDDDPSHQGTIKKIDRTTVSDLREISAQANRIQDTLDQADIGLNPLGLAKNVVPFDIKPQDEAGRTHFEQIWDRALIAVGNALTVFDHANKSAQSLRQNQDDARSFASNVSSQEADYTSRLIEVFGYPYPEDKDPLTGNTYGPDFNGPDLYNYFYVNTEDLIGLRQGESYALPQAVKIPVLLQIKTVNDDGSLSTTNRTIEYNVVPGFGFIKPKNFRLDRKAPGEIQLAQSDLIQQWWALKRAQQEYSTMIQGIEVKAQNLQALFNLRDDEYAIKAGNLATQVTLNSLILAAKSLEQLFALAAKVTENLAFSVADSLPKAVGLAVDPSGPLRAIISGAGITFSQAFEASANIQTVLITGFEQAKDIADRATDLRLDVLRAGFERETEIRNLEQAIRELKAKEIEIFSLVEANRQASGRLKAAVAKGLRLLEERLAYRQTIARSISDYRYKDMAFRIFRNDALQKYSAQFDLAARYVYLAAKAYGYETNLLSFDTLSGERLLTRIVRERNLGRSDFFTGPATGPGLAGVLADLDGNFQSIKGVLGFNNPTISTDKFSIRSEMLRTSPDQEGNETWREALKRSVVTDLRKDLPEWNQYCNSFDPYRVFDPANPLNSGEPAIVLDFKTTIQADTNVFGWEGSTAGGESFFPSDHFSIRIKGVGVWLTDYNDSQVGLTTTPRCYLIPVGTDLLRVPFAQNQSSAEKVREWNIVDQLLPLPVKLGESAFSAVNNAWLPQDQLPGTLLQPRTRRYSSLRAYHDGGGLGGITPSEFNTTTFLVGRSVWNTRWLLIIPGRFLLQGNPQEGIRRFIEGIDGSGGVEDIRLAFQTYQFSSSKKKQPVSSD